MAALLTKGLRALREHGATLPVIVLTARGGLDDTLAALEGGADDYMAKPFRFAELVARIRLRLRAARREPLVLRHGALALDLRTRRALVDGRTVELTAREFALAEAFLRRPGQVLSRQQLLSQVWGYDHDPGSNVVDVYVRYLRRKLGLERIATVRGMGYRLDDRSLLEAR
jgi:two-component system, OmpR family, copper resistance phosphate regulon response regulator CusR